MEKKFEQEDTVSMSNAVIPSKKYLISGFELDLDSLIIYIDHAHIEMLTDLGHLDVPESMNMLEYASRFVDESDHEFLKQSIYSFVCKKFSRHLPMKMFKTESPI